MHRTIGLAVTAMLAMACSSSTSGTTGTGSGTTGSSSGTTGGSSSGNTVSISNFTFAPANITVPAGATITFTNTDTAPHTATSEAAVGDYTNAAAAGGWSFDTGNIAQNTSMTVTVPTGLASGTVQHYFCNVHKAHMDNPDPTITIQ